VEGAAFRDKLNTQPLFDRWSGEVQLRQPVHHPPICTPCFCFGPFFLLMFAAVDRFVSPFPFAIQCQKNALFLRHINSFVNLNIHNNNLNNNLTPTPTPTPT
jgi:hypothetical protein